MEATIKKELEVTLKLNGEEAIALMNFLGELRKEDVSEILDRNFREQKESIDKVLDNIYDTLEEIEELQ